MKYVYVCGDSLSLGDELGGPSREFTPYRRETCYSGIIANRWGVDQYVNTSKAGGSNDRVVRKIASHLPQMVEFINPEDVFVFISLTQTARREFFYSKHSSYVSLLPNKFPAESEKPVQTLWKTYSAYFDDPRANLSQFFQHLIAIQLMLSRLGVNYLITRSLREPEWIENEITDTIAKHPLIDSKRIITGDFMSFIYDKSDVTYGPYGHPLEKGHELWADHLQQYIEKELL